MWNGLIMMTYINYIGLSEGARDQITEEKNIYRGIMENMALLAYPVMIGIFMYVNY